MGKKEQIFDLALVAAQATRLDLFLRNEAVYPREKALVGWVPTLLDFGLGHNNKITSFFGYTFYQAMLYKMIPPRIVARITISLLSRDTSFTTSPLALPAGQQ